MFVGRVFPDLSEPIKELNEAAADFRRGGYNHALKVAFRRLEMLSRMDPERVERLFAERGGNGTR